MSDYQALAEQAISRIADHHDATTEALLAVDVRQAIEKAVAEATRPEAGATAYENLRQRCLKLGNFHPDTKGSIGDIWAEIYKHRTLRQPAAELAVGYLSEFIDNYFADTSKPQPSES